MAVWMPISGQLMTIYVHWSTVMVDKVYPHSGFRGGSCGLVAGAARTNPGGQVSLVERDQGKILDESDETRLAAHSARPPQSVYRDFVARRVAQEEP